MLIKTPSDLGQTLPALRSHPFITLDTEFMRESTYYPKLCLVQAANADVCALFDPLALDDLQPLFSLLADRTLVKVLHAARQDLEVLNLVGGATFSGPIFDTQIAAGLLGLPAQIGYGDLVAQRLGVTLTKGHARTDWTRRPLSDEQLAYAADDVRYLVPLYDDLRSALSQAGRLTWLEEETRVLENPEIFRVAPEDAWKRLKGLEQLEPESRAAARSLSRWREQRAMKHDKPRGWILHDEQLRAIAERLPRSLDALAALPGIPPAVVRNSGDEILALVEIARESAREEAPARRPVRPPPEQLARVKQVLGLVRDVGQQLGISPELLATRRDAEQLVFAGQPGVFGKGWRRDVVGEQVLRLAAP